MDHLGWSHLILASGYIIEAFLGYRAKKNPASPASIVELMVMVVAGVGITILIAYEAMKYGRDKNGR